MYIMLRGYGGVPSGGGGSLASPHHRSLSDTDSGRIAAQCRHLGAGWPITHDEAPLCLRLRLACLIPRTISYSSGSMNTKCCLVNNRSANYTQLNDSFNEKLFNDKQVIKQFLSLYFN